MFEIKTCIIIVNGHLDLTLRYKLGAYHHILSIVKVYLEVCLDNSVLLIFFVEEGERAYYLKIQAEKKQIFKDKKKLKQRGQEKVSIFYAE